MYTITPVNAIPTTAEPIIATRNGGGIISQVTIRKPINDKPAAHHKPVYKADMIFCSGLTFTIMHPTMAQSIDTAPTNKGYRAASNNQPVLNKLPSNTLYHKRQI